MNWCQKQALKHLKGFVFAAILAVFSLLLVAASLILDALSENNGYVCGWQRINNTGSATYSQGCSELTPPLCSAATAGKLWLSFCVLGALCAVVGILFIKVKKSKTWIVYTLGFVFLVAGIVSWYGDNPLCSSSSSKLGLSLIMVIVAACLQLGAALAVVLI